MHPDTSLTTHMDPEEECVEHGYWQGTITLGTRHPGLIRSHVLDVASVGSFRQRAIQHPFQDSSAAATTIMALSIRAELIESHTTLAGMILLLLLCLELKSGTEPIRVSNRQEQDTRADIGHETTIYADTAHACKSLESTIPQLQCAWRIED